MATLTHAMTTTANSLDGYRTTKTLGVVRGITVRSRSVLGSIGASLQTPANVTNHHGYPESPPVSEFQRKAM